MLPKRNVKLGQKRRLVDANSVLPDHLTTSVIDKVNALSTSPKTDYLKANFLDKFVSNETDPADVRTARAIFKWLCVERDNAATNDRLLQLGEDYNILPRVTWHKFRTHVQRLVANLLGEVVPVEALFGGFSGGASTSRSRTQAHPALKYVGKADITSAAIPWFDSVREELCLWNLVVPDFAINVVKGNTMFTVPKSSSIDRCAAKEPDLNMYMQRGVGRYIRQALLQVGIDLNDQSRNRGYAKLGSITGELATLDLSSASDSMSIELVAAFLPPLWFSCLNDLRSHYTLVDGEYHQNEMFSNMGNGFTFELESLLFWAISKTTRTLLGYHGVVSVYGDDIIVESEIARDLSWVLGVLGFTVNEKKSKFSGPIRESCGGHFFNGYDITPFYLRRPIATVRDAIIIANQIRLWSRIPYLGVLDCELEELWLDLKSHIPEDYWGGDDLGSDQQLVSDDPPCKRLVALTSHKRDTASGGYLLWLDTKWESSSVSVVETSFFRAPLGIYRKKRANADRRRPPCVFLHETR